MLHHRRELGIQLERTSSSQRQRKGGIGKLSDGNEFGYKQPQRSGHQSITGGVDDSQETVRDDIV